ncbi:MAG: ABC transporter permease [Desulfurococcaceae archaeon]
MVKKPDKGVQRNNQGVILFAKTLFTRSPELNTFTAILVLSAIIGFINPRFWSIPNLLTIFRWLTGLGLLALGQSMVLIMGGIDLSVGSMASLSSMVFAYMITIMKQDTLIAVLTVIAVALLVGFYHGIFVTRFSPPLPTTVPSFIVTLGSLILLRGTAIVMTYGYPIKIYDYEKIAFTASTQGLALILIIAVAITYYLQRYTVIGRYIYAIGGNMEAARVAGIPIHKSRMFSYIYSSLMAGLAGIVYASLVSSGYAEIATGQELFSIASCALAGVSLAGGEGTAIGALIGALLITVVRNGIVLMGVSPYWQDAVTALILVIAVTTDLVRRTWRRT